MWSMQNTQLRDEYITRQSRIKAQEKAIKAPTAPAATTIAPGGDAASRARLPETAREVPIAAATADAMPVCSHI